MGADHITKDSTMQEVLEALPGAQRALFSRYHVGGCSHCGFDPAETLEQVCRRNNILDVQEVIGYLRQSHERDEKVQILPEELARALKSGQKIELLDVRTPEEYEIARIEGARLVTEDLAKEILEEWPKETPIVVHCHLGERSRSAASFLIGEGFTNVRSLAGGIDAWSCQVDPTVPKYAAAPAHSK
ncbi:MAG TPA: rhodanese-like domain-containing protein [Candidatus Tectomicrobia bacterium]|jgi:rhodanese-related sulfurtransferase